MATPMLFTWIWLYCLIFLPNLLAGYEFDDYELYDLVEEVNTNFYELLEVNQSATSSDIRRAYRKLSLSLHPDKNPAPDAEVKFRNLVAVYEVLKDGERRSRYDEVLVNGLPDWRHAAFYYRRVRKMGLAEILLILTLILTVGHYIVAWSAYYEKRFNMEEVYRARKKKDKKSKRGAKSEDIDLDEVLESELQSIEKPRLLDLLPCLLVKFLVRSILATPSTICSLIEQMKENRKKDLSDEEDDEEEKQEERKPRRKKIGLIEALPTAYENINNKFHEADDDKSLIESRESHLSELSNDKNCSEWSDEEMAALLKAVSRYPGGTAGRWDKIAAFVGRPSRDCIAAAKEIKHVGVLNVKPSIQGITADRLPEAEIRSSVTHREEESDADLQIKPGAGLQTGINKGQDGSLATSQDSVITKRHKKTTTKTAERTLMIQDGLPAGKSSHTSEASLKSLTSGSQTAAAGVSGSSLADGKGGWSQQQQKLLEAALVRYPKSTDERWERISEVVEGKTKQECMERYKIIVERIKEKKQNSAAVAAVS